MSTAAPALPAQPSFLPTQPVPRNNRAELIEILHDFVATERFLTARGDAQIILDNVWTGLAADTSADDRQHMIGVKCRLRQRLLLRQAPHLRRSDDSVAQPDACARPQR